MFCKKHYYYDKWSDDNHFQSKFTTCCYYSSLSSSSPFNVCPFTLLYWKRNRLNIILPNDVCCWQQFTRNLSFFLRDFCWVSTLLSYRPCVLCPTLYLFHFLQISHSILDNGNGFFCFCIQDDGDDENEVNILRKKIYIWVKIDRERKKEAKTRRYATCNVDVDGEIGRKRPRTNY